VLDHIGFAVGDMERSRAFYERALAPLGLGLVMEVTPEMTGSKECHAGFGADRPFFWIGSYKKPSPGMHVAFAAKSRAAVDAFHAAAVAAGGLDNGAPGLRPHYHENYYGAFVLDPDGNNIEAVCHSPLTDQQ
jgi:catechol 2,3-dioxygenase-like lactoylglutathione lyase family enzyme